MNFVKCIFLTITCLVTLQSFSQNSKITGIVTDESGPLIGVSVIVKGSANGTITNIDGEFSINVPKTNKELVFSYLGYITQTVTIGDQSRLTIKLKEKAANLEEVVVIGYGTSVKSQIGGASLSTVNVDEMKKATVSSYEDALSGRIAGVQVTSSEGGPFSTNNIVIRGNNSVTQDNSPLWVIDGFPIEDPQNNTLNPNDIKSITVLKDATSIAIYGSRGANGVILVTTNQGERGAPKIEFDGYYGFQQTLKRMDVMNPYDYVRLQIDLNGNSAKQAYTPGDPNLGASAVIGGRTLDYYKTAEYINWQDLLYRTAPMQNYSLTLTGGTETTKYLISGSITDQRGTIIKTGFKRYQGRFSLTQEINKKISFNLNANYTNTFTEGSSPSTFTGSSSGGLLYAVWGYRPAVTPDHTIEEQLNSTVDPAGQLGYSVNPVIGLQNTIINTNNNALRANAYLNYKIIKNLELKISGGINQNHTANGQYYGLNTSKGQKGSTMNGPYGIIQNSEFSSVLNENTLNYSVTIKKTHSFNLLGGFSLQETNTNSSSLTGSQVPNDALGLSGIDEGTPFAISSVTSVNVLMSYFGRLNYNYKSKYYLTIVGRSDGSSKFAQGNKWAFFPSASLAWNVHKEKFMKSTEMINELKFRASYGISGNNRVDDFSYLSPVYLNDLSTSYPFENRYTSGAVQRELGNKDLKWETTASTDIGMDLGIFDNKVQLTIDYYDKKTTNLLLQASLPGHMGYSSAMENVGSIGNRGWEFTLNNIITKSKKFEWRTNLNLSFNNNKILALNSGQRALITEVRYDTNPMYPYIAIVGGPIAQFYGYKWLGNYQYSDFDKTSSGTYVLKSNIPDNGNSRAQIFPGDIKYEDINGDGTISDADKIIIGNPEPLFTGGFSNNFTYKEFDFNVLFSFSYGNDIYNANRMIFEGYQSTINQFSTFNNRWTPDNQTNLYPRANGTRSQAISSRVIEDGSFIRLKTIALGYSLPQNISKKINITNARVYCSAQNIFVLSNYQGSDPEVSIYKSALTPGFDFASYPRSFSMTFGVNIKF